MRTRRLLSAAAALMLLAAACDGDAGEDGDDRAGAPTRSTTTTSAAAAADTDWDDATLETFDVPAGSHPHDVAVAADGMVWYTAQATGKVGRLDPATGEVEEFDLGRRSGPHGVIVGPDGAVWVTASGLDALVHIDPRTGEITRHDLPADRTGVNVHTAVFDPSGTQWFTANGGAYGRLDPDGEVTVFDAPGGAGPYGITATPNGDIYYASLGQSHLARVDPDTGKATVLPPPTANQGTRRVWTDSTGRVWCSQWNTGQVAVYDPGDDSWQEWKLPGSNPQAYATYVAEDDGVWLSDFGANSIVRFDPETESFASSTSPTRPATFASCTDGPARCGAPSPPPTSSW